MNFLRFYCQTHGKLVVVSFDFLIFKPVRTLVNGCINSIFATMASFFSVFELYISFALFQIFVMKCFSKIFAPFVQKEENKIFCSTKLKEKQNTTRGRLAPGRIRRPGNARPIVDYE